MNDGLAFELDRDGSVPLYLQIAAAIRWQIAVGTLVPGTQLPNVRVAAELLKVNLHTVRQAYAELAKEGLIAAKRGTGSIVLPSDSKPIRPEKFIQRIILEAKRDYGLSPKELASFLTVVPKLDAASLTMVECNDSQSKDLSEQLSKRLNREVTPWNFTSQGAPPAGPIVSTYFHYTELRKRWPERIGDMHFVALTIDPSLPSILIRKQKERGVRRFVIMERERPVANAVIADIRKVLPRSLQKSNFIIELNDEPEKVLLKSGRNDLILFPPRCWDHLTERSRKNPRVIRIRYVFQQQDVMRIAGELMR